MGHSSSKVHHPTRPSRPRRYRKPGFDTFPPPYGYGYPVMPPYSDYEWPDYDNDYDTAPFNHASGFVPTPVIPPDYDEGPYGIPQPGISHIAPMDRINPINPYGSAMGDTQRSFGRKASRRSQRSSIKRRKSQKRTFTIRFSGAEPNRVPRRHTVSSPAVQVTVPDAEPVQVSAQRAANSPAVQITVSNPADDDDNDSVPDGPDPNEPRLPPRAPTPFHPPRSMDPSSSLDSSDSRLSQQQQQSPPSSDSPVIPPAPPHTHGQHIPVQIRFEPPTNTMHHAYDPRSTMIPPHLAQRYSKPVLPNPLPDPPVDLFASSPYKHLLTPRNLPSTATQNQTRGGAFIKRVITTESEPKKKGGAGLFRAFSGKKRSGLHRSKTVEYVYVPTASAQSLLGTVTTPTTMMNQLPPQSAPAHTGDYHPVQAVAPTAAAALSGPKSDDIQPIYFDQDSEYSCYLIHSRHPVFDKEGGHQYPTAAHFLEALKFLPDHPEIAEQIRMCEDIGDAQRLGKKYAQYEKPSYALGIVDAMYYVIDTKIRQHPDLRLNLVKTYPAPLKYNDPSDSFWGTGPDGRGRNELGLILERIRDVVKVRR